MQVVEVDVVDSQPTGTVLEGLADRFRSAAAALDLGAELGGEDHVVAAVGQHPSDELLVVAIAVDVGGVDVVDPSIPEPHAAMPRTRGPRRHRRHRTGSSLQRQQPKSVWRFGLTCGSA